MCTFNSLHKLFPPEVPNLVRFTFKADDWREMGISKREEGFPRSLEHSLIDLLTQLPKLKTYDVEFYPFSGNVVTVMNNCNVKLDKLQLYAEDYMSSSGYQTLLTSNVTKTLQSLTIVAKYNKAEFDRFDIAFTASTHNLTNLVELNISSYFHGTLNLLITIIQTLNSLERLEYKRVLFHFYFK